MTKIKITGKELKRKIKEIIDVNEISDELVGRAAQVMRDRSKETGIPQDKRINSLLHNQNAIKQQIQNKNNSNKVADMDKMIDRSKYINLSGVLLWGDETYNYTIRRVDASNDTRFNLIQITVILGVKSQQRDGDESEGTRMDFRYNFNDDTYEFHNHDGKLDDIKIDRKLANALTRLIQRVNPESKFKRYDFFPVIGIHENFDKIFKTVIKEILVKR